MFEDLLHDFPQRIGYRLIGPDSLLAWIEGTSNTVNSVKLYRNLNGIQVSGNSNIVTSPDGLAWELRGASAKAMTEQDFVAASGNVQRGGMADPMAQKWAENMTNKFDELAVAEPIFGQLRNCMELAIVAALVVKEDLTAKAGYSMPILLDPVQVKTVALPTPKQVAARGERWRPHRTVASWYLWRALELD